MIEARLILNVSARGPLGKLSFLKHYRETQTGTAMKTKQSYLYPIKPTQKRLKRTLYLLDGR